MSIKTQKFGGLDISVSGFNDGRNRVRDVDLGEWLDLAQPINIRKKVRALIKDGILNDFDCLSVDTLINTGLKGVKKPVTEYWLTEQAALFVVARSDQPKGVLALKMLITVFDEFRSANKKASRLLELVFRDTPIPNHKKRLFCPLAVQLSKFIAPSEWGRRFEGRRNPRVRLSELPALAQSDGESIHGQSPSTGTPRRQEEIGRE